MDTGLLSKTCTGASSEFSACPECYVQCDSSCGSFRPGTQQPRPESLLLLLRQCVRQPTALCLQLIALLAPQAVFFFPGGIVLKHHGDSLLQCIQFLLNGL